MLNVGSKNGRRRCWWHCISGKLRPTARSFRKGRCQQKNLLNVVCWWHCIYGKLRPTARSFPKGRCQQKNFLNVVIQMKHNAHWNCLLGYQFVVCVLRNDRNRHFRNYVTAKAVEKSVEWNFQRSWFIIKWVNSVNCWWCSFDITMHAFIKLTYFFLNERRAWRHKCAINICSDISASFVCLRPLFKLGYFHIWSI